MDVVFCGICIGFHVYFNRLAASNDDEICGKMLFENQLDIIEEIKSKMKHMAQKIKNPHVFCLKPKQQ